MTEREALKHLKAVTEAFGPDEGVEFDQKAWSALHAAIKEALAQPEQEPLACVINGRLMAYKNQQLPDECFLYAGPPPQ